MSEFSPEELRCSYKPDRIQVLFVGESPPAGRTFLYKGNSNMFRYTRDAFTEAFGTTFESTGSFLDYFRCAGCYLDDLCLTPVNHLSRSERRGERRREIVHFAERIAGMSPCAVVVVMHGIESPVKQAIKQAELAEVPMYSLPFPAMEHQRRYVSELAKALRELRTAGFLTLFPLCPS